MGKGRKDRSYKARAAEWLAIKALEPTLTTGQIAARMGIARGTLLNQIRKATQEGLLQFDDPLDQLKHSILPKATNNLEELIDAKDRLATLETMKNTLFKSYQQAEGMMEAPPMVLALKIEPAGPGPAMVTGEVLGLPRSLDPAPEENQ